jgi:syntaxin-binding protein 1
MVAMHDGTWIAHCQFIICSQYDKTRLLMLWISSSEGQVDEEKKQNLLAHARLDQEYKDAIDNLSLLGVQLSKSANKQGEKSKKEKKKQDSSQEVPFDLSRYVPVVKRVSEVSIIIPMVSRRRS